MQLHGLLNEYIYATWYARSDDDNLGILIVGVPAAGIYRMDNKRAREDDHENTHEMYMQIIRRSHIVEPNVYAINLTLL